MACKHRRKTGKSKRKVASTRIVAWRGKTSSHPSRATSFRRQQ